MTKRGRKPRRSREMISLNLTSMIDVTFLMLVYFMVTTVLASEEDRLNPTLEAQRDTAVGRTSDFQPQIVECVRLSGGERYELGSQAFETQSALTEALRQLPKGPGIFIRCHDDVRVGFAIAAVQAARDADFVQVTYVPHQ